MLFYYWGYKLLSRHPFCRKLLKHHIVYHRYSQYYYFPNSMVYTEIIAVKDEKRVLAIFYSNYDVRLSILIPFSGALKPA